MKKIMLVSDMDGTLLNSSQQVSEENIAAIRKFKEWGGLFTLATGRTEKSVDPYIRLMNLETPLILYNGAKIYCPATKSVLYEKTLSLPESFWSYLLSELNDNVVLLVYRDCDVFSLQSNELLTMHERKDGVISKPLPEELVGKPVTKLLLIASAPADLARIERRAEDVGLRATLVYSERNYLEILPYGANKGDSLRKLANLLEIKELYTIAVGDNLNDLSMMGLADCGYAVDNAHPLLKAKADRITVNHEQHAIAAIIYELIEKRRELAQGKI
ncbi:Cof-type HAD-IIB family hydrolase [Paenibacillus sp. J2TS4]|uniref:Cof-type HAD-IIB family hydrolase n=1 Tax=Paenibacillus sp. J2TS4 TaxID=2807194 RepID=UPI001B0CCF41|nr:Cof-type HAD-IIB family hydrolase [Paenibacillus sp. J2TS4]GIP31004.1 haloacid dehalogenase [Paenibacillus sp. J2TS4]